MKTLIFSLLLTVALSGSAREEAANAETNRALLLETKPVPTCTDLGKKYSEGETWKCGRCNYCKCLGGEIVSTKMFCEANSFSL